MYTRFWMIITDVISNRSFQRSFHLNNILKVRAPLSTLTATQDSMPFKLQKQWMFSASIALLGVRRSVPTDATYNGAPKSLGYQLTKSLGNEEEQWWIEQWKRLQLLAIIATITGCLRSSSRKRTASKMIKRRLTDSLTGALNGKQRSSLVGPRLVSLTYAYGWIYAGRYSCSILNGGNQGHKFLNTKELGQTN